MLDKLPLHPNLGVLERTTREVLKADMVEVVTESTLLYVSFSSFQSFIGSSVFIY